MKIIYLAIIFMILMMSCQSSIISESNNNEKPYIIEKIEPSVIDDLSRYHATTNTSYVYFNNNISFMKRHGKFVIGDTVIVRFVNKLK